MSEERVDIVITDKVAASISTKLKGFATDARAAHKAISDVQEALAKTANSSTSIDRAAQALSRQSTEQQKLATQSANTALAQEKLATQVQKTNSALLQADTAVTNAATAQQRLLAASATASAQQQNLATASTRAAQAQTDAATATQKLAAAQAQANAAAIQSQTAQTQASIAAQRLQTAQAGVAAATINSASATARLAAAQAGAASAQARAGQAATDAATAQQRLAKATSDAQAAADRATQAALRLKNAQTGGGGGGGGLFGTIVSGAIAANVAMRALEVTIGAVKSEFDRAETFINFQNRLRLISTSESDVTRLTGELLQVANRARAPLESVGATFQRIDSALKNVGASEKEAIQITEALTKAVTRGGLTAQEQASALLQVSQAFNKGKLDGDEFKQTMENFPQFADAIAKSMGLANRGLLLTASKEGKINLEQLRAGALLLGSSIDNQLVPHVVTASAEFEKLKNNSIIMAGAMDKALGITRLLAGALSWLAEGAEKAALAQNRTAEQEAGFIQDNLRAVGERITKQEQLIAAGNAGVAGTEKLNRLIALQTNLYKELDKAQSQASKEAPAAKVGTVQEVRKHEQSIAGDSITEHQLKIMESARKKAEAAAAVAARRSAREKSQLEQEIERLEKKTNAVENLTEIERAQADIESGIYDKHNEKDIRKLLMLARRRDEATKEIGLQNLIRQAEEQARTRSEARTKQAEEETVGINAHNQELRDETNLIYASEQARIALETVRKTSIEQSKLENATSEAERKAIQSKIDAMREEGKLKIDLASRNIFNQNAGLVTALPPDLFKGTEEAKARQEEIYRSMYDNINKMRDDHVIGEQTAANAIARIQIQQNAQRVESTLDMFSNLASLSQFGNKRLVAIAKAASLAVATIKGIEAIQGAYASPPFWPLNAPNVIAVSIAQAANVARIAASGFQAGGYTGDGATDRPAGVVHGREFVVNAEGTANNRWALEAMNRGDTFVGGMKVTINDYGTKKEYKVEQVSRDEVRIIARDAASEVLSRDGPGVVAADMSQPNSRTSKALSSAFQVARNRS